MLNIWVCTPFMKTDFSFDTRRPKIIPAPSFSSFPQAGFNAICPSRVDWLDHSTIKPQRLVFASQVNKCSNTKLKPLKLKKIMYRYSFLWERLIVKYWCFFLQLEKDP